MSKKKKIVAVITPPPIRVMASDLYPIRPNGVELAHGFDEFEDVTILVSNCESLLEARNRVIGFLTFICEGEGQ